MDFYFVQFSSPNLNRSMHFIRLNNIRLCIPIVSIVFVLLFNVHAKAQTGEYLNKDSLKKDLAVLYGLLTQLHPGADMHCTQEQLKNYYDSLSGSLSDKMQLHQFYRVTALLTARIKDGHTGVTKDAVRKSIFLKRLFPFSLYRIHQSFYIQKTGLKELDTLVGKQIISINGKKIENIINRMRPEFGMEGENESAINNYLPDFPFHYYLQDTSSTFKITVADTSGKTNTLSIKGVTYKSFKLRTVKLFDAVNQEFIDTKAAVLTIRTFSIDDLTYKGIDYKKYLDAFFSQVRDKEIPKLVIDLRGNGGGSAEVSNYLFSHLTDTTYHYFEYVGRKCKNPDSFKPLCLTPQYLNMVDTVKQPFKDGLYRESETAAKDYWWFELQKGKKKHFTGSVHVLMDGGSFSTTGHFIALLKQYNRATLYGECCQGSYYSNDGGLMFKLPYSGMEVRISTAQYKMRLPGFVYDSKGICPDVEILKSPADLTTGTDRTMTEVLKIVSQ